MKLQKLHRTLPLLALLLAVLLNSCGELFTFEPTVPPATMTLDRHELLLMVGDRATLTPTFDPDTVRNTTLYWMSGDPDIVTIEDNEIVAMGEGEAAVTAISMEMRIYDTCHVTVQRPWSVIEGQYAYEMLLYLDATLDGQPLQPHQLLGAFCDDEVRGVGESKEAFGIPYTVLRIHSYNNPRGPFDPALNPQDPLYPDDEEQAPERFVLRLYDRHTLRLYESPDTITFDGETHGTLSDLIHVNFK